MSIEMYLYKFMLILTFFFVTLCQHHRDLSTYLTLNMSRHWLKNQTEKMQSYNPYCLICCMHLKENSIGKICGKHTMCIYSVKPGPTCKGFISIQFTKDEIAAIVDIHNTIRNLVALGMEARGAPGPQPCASNMRMVEWDPELALLANRWAAQCVFTYDLCRDLADYPVGQNIAKGNYALNNDLSFIVNWYDAVAMFGYDEVASFHYKDYTTHPSPSQYSQLVWGETYKIGCARIAFQRSEGSNLSYREHFICNYGPSGNIPGQPVYKIGEPCSECPTGTGCSIEYQGLCTTEALYDVTYKIQQPKPKVAEHIENSSTTNRQNFVLQFIWLYWTLSIFH